MVVQPTRDRQAERRKVTRREILAAAWDIAHERSLAEVTLREIAERIGMRAPSLYTHFPAKNAMYDAMFEQAWSQYRDLAEIAQSSLPREPRELLRSVAHQFFDFAVADPARHQLMNQRTIPDFVPTASGYQPAIDVLAMLGRTLAGAGLPDEADLDLFIALIGGLVDAQLANDLGGSRWAHLLDRAVDMFADEVRLPGDRATARRPALPRPSSRRPARRTA